MRKVLITLTLATALCGGCSLYKMDIQQGNNISTAELESVHAGMSAEQVQAILGTPLLVDDFHKNRWDYVFYLRSPSSNTVERRSVTVFFNNGVVSDIRNELPAAPSPTTDTAPPAETK